MNQNVVLAWVPAGAVKRVYGALTELGLADAGADEISDVITCPGAYSCNLALTKTMGLGAALARDAREGNRSDWCGSLRINVERLPEFLRPALDRRYRILRQRPQDRWPGSAVLSDAAGRNATQFGVAIQSLPARLVPVAVDARSRAFQRESAGRRNFPPIRPAPQSRDFPQADRRIWSNRPMLSPEMYQDWGDDVAYSLELGRGECAA